MMFTTDLALKMDPAYGAISKRFHDHPEEFEIAFAKAWYKLTTRDMGPHARLLGKEVPPPQPWQDPVPAADYKLVGEADVASLKRQILSAGLSIPQLVSAAWASASTYRDTDMRGGANGARLRLSTPEGLGSEPARGARQDARGTRKGIQTKFNGAASGGKKISLADLIILGGCAAVEDAAKRGGHDVKVPFTPGRTDATQEMTDVEAISVLEPQADGFRNYVGKGIERTPPELLVDRADLLKLTAPEMTVLVGGLRVLDANYGHSKNGVFTNRPGTLTNDFFVNLLDMGVTWQTAPGDEQLYEGRRGEKGEVQWTATDVDLVFGSNSQLRAISEVYASEDAKQKFVNDLSRCGTR